MRIAYLTTDEVNQDLAIRMAAETGAYLFPQPLNQGPKPS
jgi:hypothetical protein